MEVKKVFKAWGGDLFILGFFFILFFKHSKISVVSTPFFIFIVWQLVRKRLHPRFLIDPVSICIFTFALTALISNMLNGIPQKEIIKILNWLFPYYLGKYAVMKCDRVEPGKVLFFCVSCAAAFSFIGIAGYLFNLKTLFGIELFDASNRYAFTISGTNRAGFYLGIAFILIAYFFIKSDFKIQWENVLPLIYLPTILCCLLLIKERKAILMVIILMLVFFIVYKKFKMFFFVILAAGVLVFAVPIPGRYHVKEMAFNKGMLGRFNAWEAAIGLFKEKPVFGHGYPSFKQAYTQYFNKHKDTFRFKEFTKYGMAHNVSLNALAETGLLGCFALNCIFFTAFRFYTYRYSGPLLFVLGVTMVFIYMTMQFGNFVHSASRTDMAFFIFGLYLSIERKHLRENRHTSKVPAD